MFQHQDDDLDNDADNESDSPSPPPPVNHLHEYNGDSGYKAESKPYEEETLMIDSYHGNSNDSFHGNSDGSIHGNSVDVKSHASNDGDIYGNVLPVDNLSDVGNRSCQETSVNGNHGEIFPSYVESYTSVHGSGSLTEKQDPPTVVDNRCQSNVMGVNPSSPDSKSSTIESDGFSARSSSDHGSESGLSETKPNDVNTFDNQSPYSEDENVINYGFPSAPVIDLNGSNLRQKKSGIALDSCYDT